MRECVSNISDDDVSLLLVDSQFGNCSLRLMTRKELCEPRRQPTILHSNEQLLQRSRRARKSRSVRRGSRRSNLEQNNAPTPNLSTVWKVYDVALVSSPSERSSPGRLHHLSSVSARLLSHSPVSLLSIVDLHPTDDDIDRKSAP